ncbi:MAG: carbohydrate binding family 9 domain-containing protein [Acidobacteria bacterium]|nr:carbohydrate binding family 9 domain-containing protein [Acidobacteriota bacterium]
MRLARRALLLLVLATSLPATGAAAAADRPEAGTVPRAAGPLRIDGQLDEAAWEAALSIPLPWEVYPGDNSPAATATSALLLFDDDNLYVGFRAEDPDPGSIRAHLTDRDTAFRNDLVGFVLDPFDDQRHGLLFAANPFGVQMDSRAAQFGEGRGFNVAGAPAEDSSWDELWDSAGRIGVSGFTVEMAIPFKSLRYPRGGGPQTWGFLAFRQRPRVERVRTRSAPLDRDDTCWFCQLGRIVLPEAPRPGPALEFLPTLTWQRTEARVEGGGLDEVEGDTQVGLSARWGITPNTSLNVALNPDFSQVEADALQLRVNDRFAVFYPEKRPLFLEGADLFATPIDAVYTRTVVDPSAVGKLTLREGRDSLGAFVARDEPTTFILPFPDGSFATGFAGANTTAVVRYRRDVGRGSSIGVLGTGREGSESGADDGDDRYRNLVGGLDGVFRFSPTDVVTAQWLTTRTDYPDPFAERFGQPEDEFSGNGWTVEYAHEARYWRWYAGAGSRSPGFRADAGFIPRIDVRSAYLVGGRSFYAPPDARWTRFSVFAEAERVENTAGDLLEDGFSIEANYSGPLQSSGTLDYDLSSYRLFFNIRPTGDFTSSINARWGDGIDFVNNRPGRQLEIEPGLTWNLGRGFYLQLDDSWQRFTGAGGRLFDANQLNTRCIYQFDLRTFVRLVLQWTAVDRNLDLYPAIDDPETEEVESLPARERGLFGQFLFAFKLSPQTVFFAGVDQRSAGTEVEPQAVVGRSYFVKFGYDWRP